MKKLLLSFALYALLSTIAVAQTTINNLGAGRGSVIGADLFPSYQGANPAVRPTATQFAAYVYGLMSADATASGVGAITLATVNANVGTFGSATSCVTTTVNAKGLTTAISAATCTPAIGSITGLGTGVQAALAAAINSSTGPVGALTATNGNCIVGNGTSWTSAACATGTVTSVGASCGNVAAPNPITTSGTIDAGISIRTVSGTTDTVLAADCGNLIGYTNSGTKAVTLPQAGTAGFATRAFFQFCNYNTGTATITPTTSTIGGAANYALLGGTAAAPSCLGIVSDGTNYSIASTPSGGGAGTVTTTGSPASGNLARFSGAASITNDNLSGDCSTNGTLATHCKLPSSGVVSGRWYQAYRGDTQAFGSAGNANRINCYFAAVPLLVTVQALGFHNNNVGSSNVQLAIYANDTATGRPSALIGNTGNISNATTGVHSGAMAANKQIGPGGSDGGREVWFCSNMNDSTATYASIANTSAGPASMIGGALGEVLPANDHIVGVYCAGANCNGGSSTFGTWPATLAGSTWSAESPSTTGIYSPNIAYQAN